MADIPSFLSQNLWLCLGLLVLVIIYILFELSQKKHQAKTLSAQDAIQLTSRDKGIFLDVRGQKAFNVSHIIGATQTSFENLKQSTRIIQKYKANPIIIYCNSGQSSKQSFELLKEQGFENVFILKGGISQWKTDNLPTGSIKAEQPKKNKNMKKSQFKAQQQKIAKNDSLNTPEQEKMIKPIEIYFKDSCPYCHQTKRLLDSKGVKYEAYDIAENPELREEMIKRSSGRKTVPEIFINDKLIGGCDDLQDLDSQGKLDPLLKPYLTV